MPYDEEKAIAYAHKWAYGRNPRWGNFDAMGGDCTNFISQCLYAGCEVMNHHPTLGWYYYSLSRRSPAWTGVEFFYEFLTRNKGGGPYGEEGQLSQAQPGDVIQLSFDGQTFAHTLLVVAITEDILLAAHTYDSDNRPLASYSYAAARLIRILGARG